METTKTALVVGANGVIGRNLVDHLAATGEWQVIGLSRRGGEPADRVRYLSVDLLDPVETKAKLAGLTEVTHVFYAPRTRTGPPGPSWCRRTWPC
ncbi:NAD-dependent epimerase/dehydratase family protein [Kitasatospora sp. NPDC101801]|uniref:NAD-dependent epimerase/dehydratase family protein n=1 Tax=Kitasatospora sp. NPDC101801 TaxID=3364103 RepID=UPI00381B2150